MVQVQVQVQASRPSSTMPTRVGHAEPVQPLTLNIPGRPLSLAERGALVQKEFAGEAAHKKATSLPNAFDSRLAELTDVTNRVQEAARRAAPAVGKLGGKQALPEAHRMPAPTPEVRMRAAAQARASWDAMMMEKKSQMRHPSSLELQKAWSRRTPIPAPLPAPLRKTQLDGTQSSEHLASAEQLQQVEALRREEAAFDFEAEEDAVEIKVEDKDTLSHALSEAERLGSDRESEYES